MKALITFKNPVITYAYTDDTYEEDEIEVGQWTAPFPNEKGNSQAFGLCELLAQSDHCPPDFFRMPPVFVSVEKLSE